MRGVSVAGSCTVFEANEAKENASLGIDVTVGLVIAAPVNDAR